MSEFIKPVKLQHAERVVERKKPTKFYAHETRVKTKTFLEICYLLNEEETRQGKEPVYSEWERVPFVGLTKL